MKIGITGQSGFIGKNLYEYLNINEDKFETIPFRDDLFLDQALLEEWVTKCEIIVHLAAMSRAQNANIVYETNLKLTNKLLAALDNTNTNPHLLYTSSIQEEYDTEYGKSKKECRILLNEWAKEHNTPFTGLILPNVYGPFARPNYASVIATFSHMLTHEEEPQIIVDAELKLIYIEDLITIISDCILNKTNNPELRVQYTDKKKVSEILHQLEYYFECYTQQGNIPSMKYPIDFNLFHTFKSYMDLS